ncbi:MAG TPA: hypothetical protein VED87_00560 [Methylocystis sp.]|nr:hypothetical protein [Methylocystis sp.]
MERRAFLGFLGIGIGLASMATQAQALSLLARPASNGSDAVPAPEPSVATAKDMESVQVEKAWYGHWRRVNRRHYRRVRRRVYRRRFY